MNRGVSIIEARVSPAADGWRLDRALADAVPTLSRERLKVLIAGGAVHVRIDGPGDEVGEVRHDVRPRTGGP